MPGRIHRLNVGKKDVFSYSSSIGHQRGKADKTAGSPCIDHIEIAQSG
jgi:hypothetical protein